MYGGYETPKYPWYMDRNNAKCKKQEIMFNIDGSHLSDRLNGWSLAGFESSITAGNHLAVKEMLYTILDLVLAQFSAIAASKTGLDFCRN